MRKNLINRILMSVLAVAVLGVAGGAAVASGKVVKIKGSDTVLPLSAAWAEAYMKKKPDAMISVTGGGSGVGLASLINGSCDIANASREVKPKELIQGRDRNVTLKATTIAKDGIAVIVNPRNSIKGLTSAQLAGLYIRAASWKEVGGSDSKIVAVGRDSSSGTYVFFQDKVLKGKRFRPETVTLPSNSAICQSVSQDAGAVGYVGLAFAKESAAKGKVRIIPVDGIAASDETVASGKYPLWRPLYCYTNWQARRCGRRLH